MPQRTEVQAPPFASVHSVNADPQSGDLIFRFLDEQQRLYRVQLRRAIAGAVVAGIIGEANRTPTPTLEPKTPGGEFQHLHLSGLRSTIGDDGQAGLVLVLECGLELAVLVAQEAVADLQSELSKLQDLINRWVSESSREKPH